MRIALGLIRNLTSDQTGRIRHVVSHCEGVPRSESDAYARDIIAMYA